MEISEYELRQLTAQVDEHHRESMATFVEQTRERHSFIGRSRRRFLRNAGLGGSVLAVGSAVMGKGFFGVASAQAADDQALAAFAQSVELAAVAAYGQAAAALSSATKPVGALFAMHHQQHADAFGALAGSMQVSGPNQKLVTALTPALAAVKDEKGALQLAFQLENQAAETYAFALTVVGIDAAKGMATILPIETEHAAVLGVALGMSVTDIFVNGAFEAAAVGDGSDLRKGIDPAVFPVA